MKQLLLIGIILLSLNLSAQYGTGSNVVSVITTIDPAQAMKNMKMILIDEMYSIRTYDAEFAMFETDYHKLKNSSLRLYVRFKEGNINISAFATNGISIMGPPSEFRAEFRNSRINIQRQGFDEMLRIADLYVKSYGGAVSVWTDVH